VGADSPAAIAFPLRVVAASICVEWAEPREIPPGRARLLLGRTASQMAVRAFFLVAQAGRSGLFLRNLSNFLIDLNVAGR
jgi:hypothetical protein